MIWLQASSYMHSRTYSASTVELFRLEAEYWVDAQVSMFYVLDLVQ